MIQVVVLALMVAGAGSLGGGAPGSVDPADGLIETLMCPTSGHYEPLATANTSEAVWMRSFIRAKVAEGWPTQRIVDTLVRQYGEGILPSPPKEGFSLTAWLAPFAAIFGGVAILGYLLSSWLRERKRQDAYLDAEIARDIDESDMQRYEAQLLKDLQQFE